MSKWNLNLLIACILLFLYFGSMTEKISSKNLDWIFVREGMLLCVNILKFKSKNDK